MNVFRVCVYTNSQRLECRQQHYGAADARIQFRQICTVLSDLPMDAICSFEQNFQTIEAYRFTRTFNTFRVDVESPSFNTLCLRYMGIHADYVRDSFDDLLPHQPREFSPLMDGTTLPIEQIPVSSKTSALGRVKNLWHRMFSRYSDKSLQNTLGVQGFSRP